MRNALENIFKIKITDETLFQKALTHPSFTKENNLDPLENYERLEFFDWMVYVFWILKINLFSIVIADYGSFVAKLLSRIIKC